jgi:hypothetical protein
METLSVILLSLLSLVALISSMLFMRGLFPARVEKIRRTLEDHWRRSFWIGLLNTVLITVLVIGLSSLSQNAPVIYLPTFAIYGTFLIGLLYGLTAFISLLGDRLFPDFPINKKDIRAGAVFLLASLLPGVGWFLLFPYGLSLSVGAVVITMFQERRSRKKAPPAE